MNYVQLCQMVHRLIGAGNEAPGSVPADAAALSAAVPGQLVYEIGKFVNDAYEEIVLDQDNWNFMVGELNIAIVPTAGSPVLVKNLLTGDTQNLDTTTFGAAKFNGLMIAYSVLAGGMGSDAVPIIGILPDLNSVLPLSESGTFRYLLVNETDASGDPVNGSSTQCIYTPYKDFRGWSDAMTTTGKPTRFTIAKDGGLWLNTYPDKTYQLRCDYMRKFVPLTTATTVSGFPFVKADTPVFPAKYHSAIAYRAAAMYCEQRPDAERFVQFQKRYLDILDTMRGEQLPEWQIYIGAYCE